MKQLAGNNVNFATGS